MFGLNGIDEKQVFWLTGVELESEASNTASKSRQSHIPWRSAFTEQPPVAGESGGLWRELFINRCRTELLDPGETTRHCGEEKR